MMSGHLQPDDGHLVCEGDHIVKLDPTDITNLDHIYWIRSTYNITCDKNEQIKRPIRTQSCCLCWSTKRKLCTGPILVVIVEHHVTDPGLFRQTNKNAMKMTNRQSGREHIARSDPIKFQNENNLFAATNVIISTSASILRSHFADYSVSDKCPTTHPDDSCNYRQRTDSCFCNTFIIISVCSDMYCANFLHIG